MRKIAGSISLMVAVTLIFISTSSISYADVINPNISSPRNHPVKPVSPLPSVSPAPVAPSNHVPVAPQMKPVSSPSADPSSSVNASMVYEIAIVALAIIAGFGVWALRKQNVAN